MELDLEQMLILLQRRYNSLRELKRLTDDLQDAVSREDAVSADLILQMRADEMDNTEACLEMIWKRTKRKRGDPQTYVERIPFDGGRHESGGNENSSSEKKDSSSH